MEDFKLKGSILILSGPSGSGKSSLYQALAKALPHHYFSISWTTRSPRANEENGKDYYFVTKEQFQQEIEQQKFLEWARVHDHYYGTSKEQIINALSQDRLVIFDIDVQGHSTIKKAFPHHTTSVFITTPSQDHLQARLRHRAKDKEESIQVRLHNAYEEVMQFDDFDYLIINDDLNDSINKLIAISQASFCKASLYQKQAFLDHWKQ